MKKYIIMVTIVIFCVVAHNDITAGYESTEREEELARTGEENEAFLTSRAEEIERMQPINDASLTEKQEQIEQLERVNDAYLTRAAERAERE